MPESPGLKITHRTGAYEIHIGQNLLDSVAELLSSISASGPVGIISNAAVNDLYGGPIREALKQANLVTRTILIPEGEEFKTLASAEQVMSALIAQGMERSGTILTLGGGVVTDLGGFVASILYRGVKLVHIPTTLLSMVDAAVGGKTGVNHTSGKNLIGSFYQPDLVIMDVKTLETLQLRDRISGYAEMFKMGVIRDTSYLEFLVDHMDACLAAESSDILIQAITRSCELKAEVVESDEKEADLRRILNFGHTLGHAIEATLGYGVVRHGEAVILGMFGAGWLSNQVGDLSMEEWDKLSTMLKRIPLELPLKSLNPEAIELATRLDKKVANSQLNFVLLHGLGDAYMQTGIPTLMIKLAVDAIRSAWEGRE
ncbi:MAG: 3-dehydroquinate synthase [FCB group bacterium]|nr:3-dehydroquinate synthase [FCB group bacterium]MBL7028608.1 3-dehydroquinate synthase [Candidatus Neomarinimicrobiota bacterium]MBL7120827.1 3-dehydroquinate synthase [Candidatus Neomarinimicrobiota bacterium]